jgi:hypothetical protein
MNPIVQFVVSQLVSLVEGLISTEGPAVLSFLQTELTNLEQKYFGTSTGAVSPTATKVS